MRPFYPAVKLRDRELKDLIGSAAVDMYDRLTKVDPLALPISEYNQKYLSVFKRNLEGVLQRYTYLLYLSLQGAGDRAGLTFMDYGAGMGVLACLAKKAGVGTVILNDIFDSSCKDAAVIAQAVGVSLDHTICGDLGDVLTYFDARRLRCDIIANWDVLEHIYDIDAFLRRLPQAGSERLRIVMASTANGANPLVRRRIVKTQRSVENQDRPAEWGHKSRDSLQSYAAIRTRMIQQAFPQMPPQEAARLGQLTRGLAGDDILQAVREFQSSGLPPHPRHATNTCDPATGNWCEQLLDPSQILGPLQQAGFRARILPGFYGTQRSQLTKAVGFALDRVIRLTGPCARGLALYYVLVAQREADPRRL